MNYFLCKSNAVFRHISSGKLVSSNLFLHSRRCLDTFILLVGCSGCLFIAQDQKEYSLKENQFMLLFPGHEHYGWKASEGELSYYWCHFQIEGEVSVLWQDSPKPLPFPAEKSASFCYLPEFGNIVAGDQTSLFFRQLLDLVQMNCYTPWLANHALSLLALRLSQDFLRETFSAEDSSGKAEVLIEEVSQWVRANCRSKITVKTTADFFHYNPDYLSSLFRQVTGISLQKYINQARLAFAKQLLLNSSFSIKEISTRCGYQDEKNFMKQFRKNEDMTPTQYRNAFFHQHLNSR